MSSAGAVVVGGGIGGLAVAGGLARAGWRVTVLERAAAFAPIGAGIALEPNAVTALAWLGLGERLAATAMAQGSAGCAPPAAAGWSGPAWPSCVRGSACRATLCTAPSCTGCWSTRRGTRTCASGTASPACDRTATGSPSRSQRPAATRNCPRTWWLPPTGCTAPVRSSLFPTHPGPAHAGYVTWRGVVDAAAAAGVDVPAAVTESWGRGQRFGIVPLADGRIYWFAGVSGPAGTGRDNDLAALAARFAGWHDPIPRLLAATDPEALLRHDIAYLREPLPSYVDGRMVLLGDAAHAITPDLGQGAALALEDAVVLTAAVMDQPDDVPAALARYDLARRERTQQLVRVSARVGRIAQWHNPAAAWLRDRLVGLVPTAVLLRASAGALSWTPPTTSTARSLT